MLKEMLTYGGDSNTMVLLTSRDTRGELPIHHAAYYGRTDNLALLMQIGGADMLKLQDPNGNTPVHTGE